MAVAAAQTASMLSTEDWSFQVTATDGAGNPFDLTSFELQAEFRTQPNGDVIDNCSTQGSGIVRDQVNTNVVTITSYAANRQWRAPFDTKVYWDLMAFKTVGSQLVTFGIGRFVLTAIAGVTHA